MSDLATLAMEKALRNLANPHSEMNNTGLKNEESYGFNDKDFLRDLKTDQKPFAKRDAADLFTASALASDKDGKLTEREKSLPSAFHSREGFGDSAHAAGGLSNSEDHRPNLSMTVSGPLNADRSVGSDSETDRDSTIFLGHCAKEDLDLVENAILRLLREDMRASSEQNDHGATKIKDAPGMDEHLEGSEVSSAGSVDLQLLSRLLDQIQTLRDQKHQHQQVGRAARSTSRSSRSVWDICKQRNDKDRRVKKDDLKKAVDAATQAAKSAADAAKVASSLANKNSEAVNKLLHSVNPSSSRTTSKQEKKEEKDKQSAHPDSSDSDEASDSEETKKIAKKIVSQNRYTHVVLGLMFVSSFVWRYIVVKVAKRVRNKVSDPWGYVQGKFTDNFKGPDKAEEELEKSEESSSSNGLPQKLKL
ncbi:hypothetical protein M758_3G232300 [Ceratodon purpureus]|nr:hypothetical protein M758_3G232300 [Ceratodon purpureus]